MNSYEIAHPQIKVGTHVKIAEGWGYTVYDNGIQSFSRTPGRSGTIQPADSKTPPASIDPFGKVYIKVAPGVQLVADCRSIEIIPLEVMQ